MTYHIYKETQIPVLNKKGEEVKDKEGKTVMEKVLLYIHSYALQEQAREYANNVNGIIRTRKRYNHVTRIL